MAYGTLFTDIYNNFKIMLQSLYVDSDKNLSYMSTNVDLDNCVKSIFNIDNDSNSLYAMKIRYSNISDIKSIYIVYSSEKIKLNSGYGFYDGELVRFVSLNASTILKDLLLILDKEIDFIKEFCPYGTITTLNFASVVIYCKLLQEVFGYYNDDEYVVATLKDGIIKNSIAFTLTDKLLQGYVFFIKKFSISYLLDYSGILSISNTMVEEFEKQLESKKKE